MKLTKMIQKQWWAVLLLNMLVLALPQAVWAVDLGGFENPSSAFSWYSKGQGCIHFRLQNSSYVDSKYWRCMKKTVFYVKDKDGNRTDVFSIEERATENGKGTAIITNLQFDKSLLFLSNDYNVSYYYIGNRNGSTCMFKNNGGVARPDGYIELDWFYPVGLSGQNMTLGLDGQLWLGGEEKLSTYQKDKLGTIEFDEITLETYDAFPATDASESGMLKIPFVSNCEIKSAQASYTDEHGRQKTLQQVTLDKGVYSGFVTVPATEVHRDLVITAIVVSGKPNESDIRSDWPHELTGDVSVTVAKAPMVHAPRLLTSIVRADSACNTSVLLRWQIAHEDYPDALDGDAFLVQRSLTGRLDDFVEIGSVMFDSKRTEYSYDDDTFISSLTPELIDAKMGFPLVRYRVVRASTKELWAMSHNPAVAYTMPRPKPLVLAKPKGVKAAWSDEENRKVSVTWQYDLSDIEQSIPGVNRGGDCHYVWDDRAEMSVVTRMYNRNGALVDSLVHVLTPTERTSRQLELTLSRSCVAYDVRLVVDGRTSPIGKATGNLLVAINSQDDWNSFATRVNNGESTLNAILDRFSPQITNLNQTVGVNSSLYQGIFIGNNNIITSKLNVHEYTVGPFRALGHGAVIAFTIFHSDITTDKQFAAGIAGRIRDGGTAFIENCEVEFRLHTDISGDATHGSVLALLDADESLFASNVLVTGIWIGNNTTNCGGLVGFARGTAFVLADRCYFGVEPLSVTSSYTFVRTSLAGEVNAVIRDCCYKTPFGKEQGSQADAVPPTWGWARNQFPVDDYVVAPDILPRREISATLPAGKFYYENHGQVLANSLKVDPLRSSALLSWATDDGPVDYFEVYRVKTDDPNPNNWQCIATQLIDTRYEDKTTSPVHTYRYYVRSANDCEGTSYAKTDEVIGGCQQTCTVEGIVRFPDGTGIPNRKVIITEDRNSGNSYTVNTDVNGHFMMTGLPYWGSGGVAKYRVAPDIPGYTGMQSVSFGTEPGQNYISDVLFEVANNVKFSGYVQYNGTSIPVQGVTFLVDGVEVHSSTGPVESDHEGKFSFRMLPGRHTIQAVKNGHWFYDKGYYYADEQNKRDPEYDFQTDKAGIYFYDDTRVKLIGRVAGGNVQAALPLDNSLGRNNLGDDLQMVLTLEGDNVSRLIWDIQDYTRKERDTVYLHNSHDKAFLYQTSVHTAEHRMVVKPDIHTGEYVVWLPPVKWKIQQITAKGYPTLFQDGMINDVVDLTDSLTLHRDVLTGEWSNANDDRVTQVVEEYHAKYSRIYHTPVVLDYKQVSYDKFDYFGDKAYNAKNMAGESVQVPLCYPVRKEDWPADKKDSLETVYTFGHPVFNIVRSYPVKISATERYYYNNNTKSDTTDVIRLAGGVVTIQNGMIDATHRDTVHLDDKGERMYVLTARQTPYMLTGDDALRTVTMTLLMDGTYYEAKPLKAYVLNQYVLPGAKDLLSVDKPLLIDILRDPPGGKSSATLSKGSTLKYAHELNWSVKGGLSLTAEFGHALTNLQAFGIGTILGIINEANNVFTLNVDLIFTGSGKEAWSYTMTNNVDISTSNSEFMVGADADVYIGAETSYTLKPMVAVRAIPESMWKQLQGQLQAGRMVEIACGHSASGDTLHLVRDEMIGIGPKVKSTFMHSQNYIINQLIPELREQCQSLMFTGTKAEAEAVADATGKNVYWSLRESGDPDFGVVNTAKVVEMGDESWEYVFNLTEEKPKEGINYLVVRPKGSNSSEDKVAEFSQSMLYWAAMIAQNEHEKLTATELVRTFDVDGGMSSSYGEGFSSDYSTGGQMKFPWDGGLGQLGASLLGSLANLINRGTHTQLREDRPHFGVEMPGYKFGMAFGPVLEYNIDTPYSEGKSYSRKESFSIGMDRQSHLIFDVYRVKSSVDDVAATDGKYDVFVNKNFDNLVSDVDDEVTHKMSLPVVGTASTSDLRYARGFVYRTRGGATQRPYEGERRTQFYSGGHVLDEATKKIEVPVLKVDRQSISGVPFGEPARLKLYMTNESEQPEAAYPYFDLMLVETSNPKGAKLMIDGMPLSGNARVMEVRPGQVTEKTLEVFAGEDFDYENLRLMLRSQGDPATFQEAQFSVHFLQGAGPVEISMPGDKWIMNTDAAYDKQRGWHMPVIISGFDKNQKNFDHIELQYKETARGDDYWTNLCAFYADSAYYRPASGTKAMIPENGNIITDFYGEGMVMEKAYDLRAVLYCRNGNGYLTSASKVLSGVKDTRRPQLFGSPDPKDGILGAGDNVVFNFSEPIEHNYLRETTNFEVKGETNETTIHEEPALLFSGSGYAQSEARRNFADKDMTVEVMVRPDTAGIDMPIFSHGTDGKQLQLWITGENRLKAIVDERELTLATPLKFDSYVQVALVLDSEKKRLTLYADTLTSSLANVTYSGYGPLVFGSTNQTDVSKRQYFKGRMLQGRVWNRVLDKTLLNFYGNKLLTGYEMGLIDYYPMNEGRGAYANDEAQGAHLTLKGASWALPRGMSLRLDWDERRSVKGMHLNERFFSRTSEEDYSLMFWFKTDVKGRGALLSNGSGRKSDMAAEDKFFIGFEADTLKYRSNGMEYSLGTTFSDDAWHHYAMTVNRAHQVASIYVDNVLKAQFATENLGGMTGSDFYLGNMVWHEQGPANDVLHQYNALTGYIDGICLFEQALPTSLIRRYSSKALGGSEKGLKVYLDFNRQERQKNGDLVLRPYTASQKIYYDPDGRETGRRDTVFIEADETVRSHIDQSVGAPIQAYEELRNLNFSFVGRDHQLLVNLDEIDARINKRTVYVTVFDIPDLNGNSMASPATMSVFVDRNPLRWAQKTLREVLWYDGYDYQFTVDIMNNSGAAHTFKVENMPKWLSVDRLSDVIEPKSEQWLRFTINKDTNVGTYDHIIYLTDENGLSEPLMLNITVEGTPPGWEVAADMKQYSMSVVGRVQIGDDIVTDSRDIVGVFDNTGRCMGCSNVNYDPLSAEALAYLTVYSDEARDKSELIFKLWHYATGKTMVLEESQQVEFTPNGTAGTAKEPIVLKTNNLYIQELKLEKGWNWVSFNVYNNHFREGVNDLLGQFDWQEGDILVDETNSLMLVFKNSEWVCNLTPDVEKTLNLMAATNKLSVGNSYRIKVAEPVTVELTGTPLSQPSQRVITVVNGWNYIGYTPMVNLRVTSALADYYDQATDGDVVKSKTEFAMFTKGANGKGEWKGNLKYMKPGEGYMLKRQRENRTSFSYPFMEVNASIPFLEGNDRSQENPSGSRETGGVTRGFANNMTLAAITDGVSLQEGDRLIALAEAEVRGEALVGDSVVYMTISGDQQTPLSFAIERGGEIVALTGNVMTFQTNAVSGSPDKPTLISFEPVSLLPQEGWFTLQGARLKGRPGKRGVYIYNGHKQMIR